MTENQDSEDRQITDEELLLASTLVDDAKVIRHLDFKHDPKSLKSYMWYNHWILRLILYLCVWCNLSLAILERPAIEPVGIPYWGTMVMEIVFLSVFVARFLHGLTFQEKRKFWQDPKNLTVLGTVILTVIDIICYVTWVNVASAGIAAKAVRWSRPLRPLFLVNFPEGRQLRQAFRNIRRTLPDILNVLILFLFCVAIFSLVGHKLMRNTGMKKVDGSEYFNNYFDAFWDLYVLVTTSNNPDIMMPAYDKSNWYSLFFVVYLILCLYIFMSIVLAVIYNRYRIHLKGEVKDLVYLKRRILGKAFDVLKTWKSGRYVVTKDHWMALMKVVDPKKSSVRVNLLFHVLDDNADTLIERKDFLKMADLLNVNLIEVVDSPTFLETIMPKIYLSRPSQFMNSCIRHRGFRYFYDLLILANAICIAVDFDVIEWFFLGVFILEILLKMYALGPVKFFKHFWNIFDFIIILSAVIATIVDSALHDDAERSRVIELILVARVLRLIRLMGSIDRFKVVIRTIVNIGPSIVTYGGVIFVVYYIYAIIGMEIFKDKISFHGYKGLNASTEFCGGHKLLKGSEFYNKHYCKNNFNNIGHAFVLLFELMVVNQWHVLTNGYVLVTNKAARLYFISFHMLCVVILLNIFTAFVLEVFILEYTLSDSKLQNDIEKKIKEMGLSMGAETISTPQADQSTLVDDMEINEYAGKNLNEDIISVPPSAVKDAMQQNNNQTSENGDASKEQENASFKFRLKKTSSKKIEVLLQNMFEGELDPEDEGLEEPDETGANEENSENQRFPIRFTNMISSLRRLLK